MIRIEFLGNLNKLFLAQSLFLNIVSGIRKTDSNIIRESNNIIDMIVIEPQMQGKA
jgi:hypothetical protein